MTGIACPVRLQARDQNSYTSLGCERSTKAVSKQTMPGEMTHRLCGVSEHVEFSSSFFFVVVCFFSNRRAFVTLGAQLKPVFPCIRDGEFNPSFNADSLALAVRNCINHSTAA